MNSVIEITGIKTYRIWEVVIVIEHLRYGA